MTPTDTASGMVSGLLDWLASPPPPDIAEEIIQLRRQLDALALPGIAPQQHHRCIELFGTRAQRMAGELQPRLVESGLPLSRKLYTSARQLSEALIAIAEGFRRTLVAAHNGEILPQHRLIETLAGRGLLMLAEAQKTQGLAGGGHAHELWPHACALFAAIGPETMPADPKDAPDSASAAFRRLLALGALQLERFSQNELCWICSYLNHAAAQVEVGRYAPEPPTSYWYWLAPTTNAGPQALLQSPAPSGQNLIYFSTLELARLISAQLTRLEAGQQPAELELPRLATGVQPQTLLQRLRTEWTQKPRRERPRSKAQYRVQACTGLEAFWKVLSGRDGSAKIHDWQVLNESPGGYSILHVATGIDGLSAGMAIALRQDEHTPWSLCIVRWIRNDNPLQIELGLQVVSTGASPVRVGFRGGRDQENRMVEALVLPAAPELRKQPAILAPAGTYTSRRFALVSDADRIYIAQGRLLSLDMQTACVELFQFEIDPYPI